MEFVLATSIFVFAFTWFGIGFMKGFEKNFKKYLTRYQNYVIIHMFNQTMEVI